MTDNLPDRIAATLYRNAAQSIPNSGLPWLLWEDVLPEVREIWLEMAVAVIRELGLTQAYATEDRGGSKRKVTRYVTEWEADE